MRLPTLLTSGVIAMSLLAACGAPIAETQPPADSPPASAAASSAAPTATPSPSSSPSPPPTSPLTGLPMETARPVLVMKIDNTRQAQPHAGLVDADVVYLEEVEYGITRIAAVFSSRIPSRIGPIRSARITDIDLVAQYGNPALGFSGAQRKLFPALADGSFIDVSANKGGTGYSRDRSRPAPYNYYADGAAMLERAGDGVALATDMGWTFGEEPPAGGTDVASATMTWDYAKARFAYDPASGDYRIRLNGRPAQAEETPDGQRADTVVIQSVRQVPSKYHDKWGAITPDAKTIGSGPAVVLRDGKAYEVTWTRPDAASPTTYTMADGSTMPFKPGQTWIVLYDRSRTPVLRPAPAPVASASASPTAS